MFLEYINLLKTGAQPEFSSNYILPMAIILLSFVVIIYIGYKIKEELGALVAILICGFIFLYMNDMLKILF